MKLYRARKKKTLWIKLSPGDLEMLMDALTMAMLSAPGSTQREDWTSELDFLNGTRKRFLARSYQVLKSRPKFLK